MNECEVLIVFLVMGVLDYEEASILILEPPFFILVGALYWWFTAN